MIVAADNNHTSELVEEMRRILYSIPEKNLPLKKLFLSLSLSLSLTMIKAADNNHTSELVDELRRILYSIPEKNLLLLKKLFTWFKALSQRSAVNKMDDNAIAVSIGIRNRERGRERERSPFSFFFLFILSLGPTKLIPVTLLQDPIQFMNANLFSLSLSLSLYFYLYLSPFSFVFFCFFLRILSLGPTMLIPVPILQDPIQFMNANQACQKMMKFILSHFSELDFYVGMSAIYSDSILISNI